MSNLDYNLDELFSYVNNSNKYRSKLETSIQNQLWEYATVLVWKTTILFIYEKLFQINSLKQPLPDAFNRQLQNQNIQNYSCFGFCCIDDENIHTNLQKVWNNLENNYKISFKGLLDKRNSLSHVNKYEDAYNEIWFRSYFEEALNLIKYIHELHLFQYGSQIYDDIRKNVVVQYVSEKEIYYFIDDKRFDNNVIFDFALNSDLNLTSDRITFLIKAHCIDSFLKSNTFDLAYTNGNRVLKIMPYLTEDDVKHILKDIYNSQKTGNSNQILNANKMEDVILTLFDNTINFNLDNDWISFYNQLNDKYLLEKYAGLKSKILETYNLSELVKKIP